MKLLSKIIALAALLPLASTFAIYPRNNTPSAVVVNYRLFKCTQTDATGKFLEGVHTLIYEDHCVPLLPTLSFQTFLYTPCPKGLLPVSEVFTDKLCKGPGIVEKKLGPVSDKCFEDITVGKSAIFRCV